MKIFLDANILFSAACPGSRTGKFLTLVAKRANLATSAYAVEEARRNLVKHRPGSLPEFSRLLKRISLTTGAVALADTGLPEKDRPGGRGHRALHASPDGGLPAFRAVARTRSRWRSGDLHAHAGG